MLRYRKLSALVIVSLLLSLSLNCQAGSTGSSIFGLPVTARSLVMGNVYADFRRENSGLLDGPTLTSLYSNQFGELSYATAELRSNNWAISYRELRSGELTERGFRGKPTGNTFRYRRRGLTGQFSKLINDVRLKLKGRVLQKRTGVNYLGGSLSPSVSCEINPFVFGAEFHNLITSRIFESDEGSSPWNKELTFGFGFDGGRFNFGMDIEAELHERGVEPGGIRLGSELWITDFVAVRIGVLDQLRHTIGWEIRGGNIHVNYAFLRHSELPDSHFVSFSWVFED